MAGFTGTLAAKITALLTSTTTGVSVRIGAMEANDPAMTGIAVRSVVSQNVSIDIAESTGQAQYPALLVYCDKVQNLMQEKFRTFSGKVQMVIEVRYTQATLNLIEQNTEMYVDAVCALLSDAQGDWGGGASYSGGYQVSYEPVVRGGTNFIQRAKVSFAVELSQ